MDYLNVGENVKTLMSSEDDKCKIIASSNGGAPGSRIALSRPGTYAKLIGISVWLSLSLP